MQIKFLTTLSAFLWVCHYLGKTSIPPYTRFGLGEVNKPLTTHYLGMGGLSVSYADFNRLIFQIQEYSTFKKNNPAYDLGITGKFSNYRAETNGEINTSQNNFSLNNMLIGLPITKRCGVTLEFYLILQLVTIFLPIHCFLMIL